MERSDIERVIGAVLSRMGVSEEPLSEHGFAIPVEVSARHAHLSKEHCTLLFGEETLAIERPLSQPGQFLSSRRVRLIGPSGMLEKVAVLGPARGETQVEISKTDARILGVDAPVRLSGDLMGAAELHIQAGNAMLKARCAIVAKRHLHLTPKDAAAMGVTDGQEIQARLEGERPLTFDGVAVRISKDFATALHLDTDEANAAGAGKGTVCRCLTSAAGVQAVSLDNIHAPARKETEPEIFSGKLITEAIAVDMAKKGVREIALGRGQLVTPSARDVLMAAGVRLLPNAEKRGEKT